MQEDINQQLIQRQVQQKYKTNTLQDSIQDSTLLSEHENIIFEQKSQNQAKPFKLTNWRWVQLFLISLYNLSNLYGQQMVAPIQTELQDQLDISPTQYNAIYTGYALPNIVLPIFAGIGAVKFGMKKSILAYTIILCIGQGIQWVAVVYNSYTWLMIGVVIFGIGSNGGFVLMNAFTCCWFFNRELSLALAIGNAVQYGGQMVASVLIPVLYDITNNVNLAFLYSFIQMIVLCLFPVFFMALIDIKGEKIDKQNNIEAKQQDHDQVSLSAFKKMFSFGKLFWYVQIITIFAYIGLCYNNNINQLLQENYQVGVTAAGDYAALQFLVQIILTPIIGGLTDKIGKRSEMVIIAGVINIIQFIIFLIVPICPEGTQICSPAYFIIPLVLGGISNSLFGAVFQPMTALAVEKQYVEVSFGVQDGMTQIGNSIGPIVLGVALSQTKKENGFFWFFLICIIAGVFQLLFSVLILIEDNKNKKVFNLSAKEIEAIEAQEQKMQEQQLKQQQQDQNQPQVYNNQF